MYQKNLLVKRCANAFFVYMVATHLASQENKPTREQTIKVVAGGKIDIHKYQINFGKKVQAKSVQNTQTQMFILSTEKI